MCAFQIWNKSVCHLLSAQKLCVYYNVCVERVCEFNEKLTKTDANVYECVCAHTPASKHTHNVNFVVFNLQTGVVQSTRQYAAD